MLVVDEAATGAEPRLERGRGRVRAPRATGDAPRLPIERPIRRELVVAGEQLANRRLLAAGAERRHPGAPVDLEVLALTADRTRVDRARARELFRGRPRLVAPRRVGVAPAQTARKVCHACWVIRNLP